MRPGERVACDLLPAFHTFQQKRMPRPLRQTQIRAHWRQQIRRKHVVHRDEIASLSETLKPFKGRLDHRITQFHKVACSAIDRLLSFRSCFLLSGVISLRLATLEERLASWLAEVPASPSSVPTARSPVPETFPPRVPSGCPSRRRFSEASSRRAGRSGP